MVKNINNEIVADRVCLIDIDGTKMGEMLFLDAHKYANDKGLDLVQMNDNKIPICKILDYSKMIYEQKKNKKKNNKTKTETKELKLRPTTEKNDLDRLISQANKFISKGNSVRFTIQFRGREVHNIDNAISNFDYIDDNLILDRGYMVKRDTKINNRRMNLIISR